MDYDAIIISLALGFYLVSAAGNILPGRPAFLLMPAPAFILFLTLNHPGKRKRQITK